MGFGYLLLGNLVTFVLYLTVQGLGFGGIALLLGYGVMLLGLSELCRYHRAFAYAKWLLFPLLITALYDLLNSFDEMLLWDLSFLNGPVEAGVDWITFLLLILFNLSMLYGIRMISQDLGILHMSAAAMRNSFFVGVYALLYIVAKLPLQALASIEKYLVLPLALTNLIWVVCNLLLLLACNKNICRAGDEEQPAKPSRFACVNRIGDAYEKTRQKSIDNTTRQAEDILRRRQEKRNRKKKRK